VKPRADFVGRNGHVEKWAEAITPGPGGRLSESAGGNLSGVEDVRILGEHRWLAPMGGPERKHVFA
jgi:hypothetical protein